MLDLDRIAAADRPVFAGFLAGFLLLASVGATVPMTGVPANPRDAEPAAGVAAGPHQAFEVNRGQAGWGATFISRDDGFVVGLDPDGLDLTLPGAAGQDRVETLRLDFLGGARHTTPVGIEPLPGTVNYLAGADPGAWITAIPTFAAVHYAALYPGIDLTVRGDDRRLEMEFTLAADADGTAIALGIDGTRRVVADGTSGDLLLATPESVVRFIRPPDVAFVTGGGTVTLDTRGLAPGRARSVRIALQRSPAAAPPAETGADAGAGGDRPRIAVDALGNTYVAGRTLAVGIGGAEAFVSRFDRGATTARYTTYFGGGDQDVPMGIAVGEPGADGGVEVVVTGSTRSRDFPVARAIQPGLSGASDAFVLRLTADGSSPVYSTYLGGAGDDAGRAVALAANGATWIAGRTTGRSGGTADAFFAAISADGADLLPATLLGGRGEDSAEAVGVDPKGRIWVAGTTRSPEFPGAAAGGAFVATIDPDSGVLLHAARFGNDGGTATTLAFGPRGEVYVGGSTDRAATGFVAVVPPGDDSPGPRLLDLGADTGSAVGDLAADARGSLWVAGGSSPVGSEEAAGAPEPWVVRVPPDGGAIDRRAGAGIGTAVRVTGLALDSTGRPLVTGLDRSDSPVTATGATHTAAPRLPFVQAAAAGGMIVAGPLPAAAGCPGTIQFDGGAGTSAWTTATNWSSDQLPGAADDVCIPAGFSVSLGVGSPTINTLFVETGASLTLASSGVLSIAAVSQIDGGLSLTGGTLTGTGEVTVNGAITWSVGLMTGAGTTNANGGIAFSGTGLKDITTGRVLNTAGTITVTGTGGVRVGSGASIHNSGLWDTQVNASVNNNIGGAALFENQAGATFRKSAGTGTTTIGLPFDNAGTLEVQVGTINLTAGGTGTGAFSGSPGTTLQFGGGTYTLDAASTLTAATVSNSVGALNVNGAYNCTTATGVSGGTMTFDPAATVASLGGTASVAGGTLALNSGEPINVTTLTMSSGVLQGTDTITVSGTTTWTGGAMAGAGVTNADGGIAFTGAGVKDVTSSRVVNTAGSTTWAVSSTIRVGGGGSIRNTGTWDVQVSGSINALTGAALFTNASGGTFKKSAGGGLTTISVPFDNDGTLDVQNGTVNLNGGGTGTGSFAGSPGAALEFGAGSYTLAGASSVTAAAVVISGATLDVNGTYAVTGSTSMAAGAATFNPAATVTSLGSALSISVGTVTLESGEPIGLTTLNLSNGILEGSDTVTVSGTTTWTAGTIRGLGTFNANGGIAFSGTGVRDLTASRVLNTAGITTWTGTFGIRIGSGASIHNSGTWNISGDATITNLSAAAGFENLAGATFRKSTASGSTTVAVPFTNAGTVSIDSGTVALTGGGTASGTFTGTASGTLLFGGGAYILESASSVALGAVSITLGTLEVNGAYDVSGSTTITSGTATFHPAATVASVGAALVVGTGSGTGTMDLGSGEPIDVTTLALAGGTLQGADTVTVSGTMSWVNGLMTGAGAVNANGGIAFSGTGVRDLTAARVLNTAGTTTWPGGFGVRIGSGASLHNSGTWNITGDATMTNLGAAAGFENLAGGTFAKSGGVGTTTLGVPFSNSGDVRAQAGILSFTAGYTQTAGSTAAQGGILASNGTLDIQGGSVGGSGTLSANIANAGHLTPGLSSGVVTIGGTVTQTAGAAFDVELGGLVAGAEHDQANITGVATLAGALNVTLVNGFTPADLDTFTIMTFGSATGSFSSINLPTLGGDLVWKVHNNPTSIVLEVLDDLDGDGVRNMEDCAPQDPTVWAVPAEVAAVALSLDGQAVSWGSLAAQAGPATTYDALRGLIAQLPAGGGAAETCLASGSAATQLTDATSPAVGTGIYYLTRGRNICGIGSYGTRSNGVPRTPAICP